MKKCAGESIVHSLYITLVKKGSLRTHSIANMIDFTTRDSAASMSVKQKQTKKIF